MLSGSDLVVGSPLSLPPHQAASLVPSSAFQTAWTPAEELRGCVMAHKLFVGGLAFSTSSERLREVFAAVGSVETSSVVTDRSTGQSRGFGFVEMATAEDAQQAVSRLNGQEVDGRQIRVEMANPSTGGSRGGGFQRGGGGGGRW
jgi:RNA recognition motif-containing protein